MKDAPQIKKPIAVVQILIYDNQQIAINSGINDQSGLRNILHAAEEIVIQGALTKATEAQSKIVKAPALSIIQPS